MADAVSSDEESSSQGRVTHLQSSAPCLKCGRALPPIIVGVARYMDDVSETCAACGADVDWFETIKVARDFMTVGFGAIGATLSIIEVPIAPNEIVSVNLEAYVGRDKRLLSVTCLPLEIESGSVSPIELHDAEPSRAPTPEVQIFGRVHGKARKGSHSCQIAVVWVPHSPDDASWSSLVDAHECFHKKDYAGVIIPANVAVESRLARFFSELLQKRILIGKERSEAFLQDGATYGHQLDVLLPLVVSLAGWPRLRGRVAVALKQLKKFRNDIAHRGETRRKVDYALASELLTATVLGVVYVERLRARMTADLDTVADRRGSGQ
jgi:hypothetical protein